MQILKSLVLVCFVLIELGPTQAISQESTASFPSRLVTIIVPFPPGGPNDLEFRVYANKMRENTGKPFIVDYKPGAGGLTGTAYVAKATPDGYTLLGCTGSFAALPALSRSLPYDSIKDIAPISQLASRSSLLVVHPSLPVKTLGEYVGYARANPGKINFGTPGLATGPHLSAIWLHSITNTDVTYIHYKGSAQLATDMVAGRVVASISPPIAVLANLKAGRLRAIASSAAERNPVTPDVLTVKEQGWPAYDHTVWSGAFAPGGTPIPIINKLNAEFVKAIRSPEIVQKMSGEGNVMVGSSPEAFKALVITEIERYRKLVKEAGIEAVDQ